MTAPDYIHEIVVALERKAFKGTATQVELDRLERLYDRWGY